MRQPRFLVIEGNTAEAAASWRKASGETMAEGYARTLRGLSPNAACDICRPAELGSALPEGAALEGYDGVAITGSQLNLWKGEPEALRQVELARAVFAAGVPLFGSCWGIQVAAVAAGGEVAPNPKGREIGVARNIRRMEGEHPLLAGRPAAYDAPVTHLDMVTRLPEGAIPLASNGMTPVQAAEFRMGEGVFWGVQYHPEFSLRDIGLIIARVAPALVAEGLAPSVEAAEEVAADWQALGADPGRRDLAWRYGIPEALLGETLRVVEIANWIDRLVRPAMSARGRA